MATTDIGRAVPLLRGEYDPAQTYELNDIVSLNGSLYWHYSHEVTTNVAPQATSTWKIVLSLTDAEAYIARAETAAEEAESAKDDAVTAKTAAETASAAATGASEAATAAKDDAVTARNAAQTAETGAVEAKNAAVSAKEAAQSAASSAGTSATNASNSAGTAEYYAENAETAAETATTKASEASASAATASSAATTATGAKTAAETAASTATTKAGEASTSATSAASSAAAAQAVKDSIPEDYSELSEDVSELKTQVSFAGLPEVIDFTPGSRVNMSGEYITIGANSGWRYAKVSCSEGVGFVITANSGTGTTYKAWCFTDATDKILTKSSSGNYTDEIVVAPEGAAYIYINDQNTGGVCYKNLPSDYKYIPLSRETDFILKNQGIDKYGLPLKINKNGFVEIKKSVHIVKDATNISIEIGRIKFALLKVNNPNHNVLIWRTNACYITNDNGDDITIWAGSDSDGVLRLSGESDYIGGYHGNEQIQSFHLAIDGVSYADDSIVDTYANTVVLSIESEVYHYTANFDGSLAFSRNKILKFDNNGITISNYWKSIGANNVNLAYFGMLSVNRYADANRTIQMLTGYTQNDTYSFEAQNSAYEASEDLTEVEINTIYGNFEIKCTDLEPSNKIKGSIANYTGNSERLKTYLGLRDISLTDGEVLKGKTTITYTF